MTAEDLFNPGEGAVLSVDAGSQSVRAAIYSVAGQRLGFWQQPCRQVDADQAFVEQDAGAIVEAATACLEQLPAGRGVSAAAIVSQGASVVCWNRGDGRPLSPVVSWQDRRGEEFVDRLSITSDEVHAITGLPLSSHYGASKLRWCLEHLPNVQDAHRKQELTGGPLVSFLLFHLCREHPRLVDSGSASRTQLWNLHDQQWDATLTRLFGVPAEILPQGVNNVSQFGQIEVAGEKVPVVMVNRDQQAAIFAAGRPRADTAYVNLGTGAFIQCLVPAPHGPPELLVNRVLSGDTREPPLYSLEGTVHGAAGAMAWMERELGHPITPKHLADALALEPDRDKPVHFINGVMGMGSPYWRATCASRFSPWLSDGEKLLAWLESLVFMLIDNLRMMFPRVSVEHLRVSGGLSRLPGLAQRLADLSGLECSCDADHEASLRGAAFLAAGQPEHWQTTEPDRYLPRENAGLAQRYQLWQRAMNSL
jgi:glycerol kinase